MHLRSIGLRGFKSFADRTTLQLEQGLVGIVGPNGAGKSNMIDALVWSLGTLSARTLRAERMEDVIFTGTENRKALGMAQVVLTFDNSDGTFPVSFSEVQVGRTLFRDGASEFSINGTACRLLDVQELLAEAGLGREMHTVVAQGQVDDIVQSKPTELRGYIEEAAGISKHRRRKERALRKIEQVSLDVDRVADLVGEMRRQLRPLRAQAEQARRHTEVTERLREVKIRRLVGELEALERDRAHAVSMRQGASEAMQELRSTLEGARSNRLEADRKLDSSRRASVGMRRGLEHLRSAQASGLRGVIVLRERAHAQPDLKRHETVITKLRSLDEAEQEVRQTLDGVARQLDDNGSALAEARKRSDEIRLSLATDGERLTQVSGEVHSLEASSRASLQAEIAARAEASASSERVERASAEVSRLQDQAAGVRKEIEDLDSAQGRLSMTVERLEGERRESVSSLEEAEARLRSLESEHAILQGRAETLRVAQNLATERRRGAEVLMRSHARDLDARGVFGEMIRVPSGLERAVEAALGSVLDALVVSGSKAVEALEKAEAEKADVVIVPTLPSGSSAQGIGSARPLAEVIDAPSWLRGTVEALCDGVYLVSDPSQARAMASEHPQATFVSSGGRVVRARGASRPAPSGGEPTLALQHALERATAGIERIVGDQARWSLAAGRARESLEGLEAELKAEQTELAEIEGRIAAGADRLRELEAAERTSSLERDLATRDRDEKLKRAETCVKEREELEAKAVECRSLQETLTEARASSQEALDAVTSQIESIESSQTELLTHRASLEERVRGVVEARAELEAERADVEAGPTKPEDLERAEALLARLDAFVSAAEGKVRALLEGEEVVEAELRESSEEVSRLEVQIASLEPRSLHSSEEVARLDVRIEEIGTRIAHEFEIPPARAREEFPQSAEDESLVAEEARLEREVRRMGPVNPLAVQEISSLDQRREFLEGQLEDLRSSRRDLMKVVRAADAEMRELLVRAAEDANATFQEVIGLLFPEGGGRIRLAGADDPLEAGVEIEVRLGRKGHRRLSFLSGGEKALAGLAFLFALHLARPTPFMVLDEVDAPLDDANLGRFLRLLDSLRARTQVIVITHQKRTMERADTLVGVTLNPDGSSRVVTQRLKEHTEHVANGRSSAPAASAPSS